MIFSLVQRTRTQTVVPLLVLLALLTCITHTVFGIYYATHAENLVSKPTLRMSGLEFLRSFRGWDESWENDNAAYNRAAMGILRTGTPRNRSGAVCVHALVYDYFLAACYAVGGTRLLSVAIPQGVLMGLTCFLIGMTATRIAPICSALTGTVASLLILTNLRFAMYVGYMLPTILLLFFVSLATYAATGRQTRSNLALFVGAIVLAIFTQAGAFVFAGAAMLWLLAEFVRRSEKIYALAALVILIFIGGRLVISRLDLGGDQSSPWQATDKGAVLWEANNPYYESMRLTSLWERRPDNPWTQWRLSAEEQQRHLNYLERTQQDPFRAALLWIRENPLQYSKLCLVRLRAELGPFTGMMSPKNRLISTIYWLFIFPAGLWGLWNLRHHSFSLLTVLIMFAIFTFDTLVNVDWYLRYRFPVDLILTAYAAAGYVHLFRRHAASQRSGHVENLSS